MLRKRLVTVLTFNDGVLFRTKKFNSYRYTLKVVDTWDIDEIVVLDITRREKKTSNRKFFKVISKFTEKCLFHFLWWRY